LQFAPSDTQAKNCKTVCLCQRYQQNGKKYENTTIYIKNRRYSAIIKLLGAYQVLCITESLVLRNRLLLIVCQEVATALNKKLMDDIPNKIRNSMGISVEVNLLEDAGNHFIEIGTPPYSVPISLRGRYYYRSGSTKQELTGASLNEFLLKKSGKTWDDVVEPRASFDDIDEAIVAKFLLMAREKGRLPEVGGLTTEQIFDKLRLIENGQLKRAAIILFGRDPGKFYPSIYVKIGRFRKDDTDLVFQETEEGNLIYLHQAIL